MDGYRKSPIEFSVEDLDRELIARGAQVPDEKKFVFKDTEGTPERDTIMTGINELYKKAPPLNEALAGVDTWDLAKIIIFKTGSGMDVTRGPWSDDVIMDCCDELMDDQVKKNTSCTAAVCLKDNLIDIGKGSFMLKVKKYQKAFNLCDMEPFGTQPVSAGAICTGFLVKEDVIVTSAHFVNENNVTDLRIVFGYKMIDTSTPVTKFSNDNIYRGVKILHRVLDRQAKGRNWVLVKLDRAAAGQSLAVLSRDKIAIEQEVYVIGHPLGLPMKLARGLYVQDNSHETHFSADLNIYSSSIGSPVFDFHTHEVIGMVGPGTNRDFRWTGNGWMSINYPGEKKIRCIRVSQFMELI
jgi:hypothetical protein